MTRDVAFKTGDVIQSGFTSTCGSWSPAMNVGDEFRFTIDLPVSPVSLNVSGNAVAGISGAEVSMSSIDDKYKGVEFMAKSE